MKKSLLFILILFGALSLHAQTHKHYKDTIDVVMASSGIITQPNPPVSVQICRGTYTFNLGAVTGGSGTVSYTWQRSYDNENWVNVQGPNTTLNYTTPTLEWGTVTYFRRVANKSGCSITSNSAAVTVTLLPPLPTFMAYNLGADSTLNTPALQMGYMANNANGTTVTETSHGRVYGGRYQWGRTNLSYAISTDGNYTLYEGNNVHAISLASITTPSYDANGQIMGQDNNHVYNTSTPHDWRVNQCDSLWGNGVNINIPTPNGGVLHTDGNYYQKPNKGIADPCPTGYRVPTQNEWERLCNYDCNPSTTSSNTRVNFSAGIGKTNSGLTWVAVACINGYCKINTYASVWFKTNRGGCALYMTSDWEAANYDTDTDLITAATQPIIFLPATGLRYYDNGFVSGHSSSGYYWSSSVSDIRAYHLSFGYPNISPDGDNYRSGGHSVRCVKCGAEPCP